jgi:hypothetical protein
MTLSNFVWISVLLEPLHVDQRFAGAAPTWSGSSKTLIHTKLDGGAPAQEDALTTLRHL